MRRTKLPIFYPIVLPFLILLLLKRSEIGSYINSSDIFRVFFIPQFFTVTVFTRFVPQGLILHNHILQLCKMLNADSGPVKRFFKLLVLKRLKTPIDSKARLCQKTGFGCLTKVAAKKWPQTCKR